MGTISPGAPTRVLLVGLNFNSQFYHKSPPELSGTEKVNYFIKFRLRKLETLHYKPLEVSCPDTGTRLTQLLHIGQITHRSWEAVQTAATHWLSNGTSRPLVLF